MTTPTEPSEAYVQLGGADGLRKLVDAFYDIMDSHPDAQTVRAMHPPDLAESRDKLFWFLSGWVGGPQLFIERRGHPRLRARHLPFAIDTQAADVWMMCMRQAMAQVLSTPEQHALLDEPLARLAMHMRNQPE